MKSHLFTRIIAAVLCLAMGQEPAAQAAQWATANEQRATHCASRMAHRDVSPFSSQALVGCLIAGFVGFHALHQGHAEAMQLRINAGTLLGILTGSAVLGIMKSGDSTPPPIALQIQYLSTAPPPIYQDAIRHFFDEEDYLSLRESVRLSGGPDNLDGYRVALFIKTVQSAEIAIVSEVRYEAIHTVTGKTHKGKFALHSSWLDNPEDLQQELLTLERLRNDSPDLFESIPALYTVARILIDRNQPIIFGTTDWVPVEDINFRLNPSGTHLEPYITYLDQPSDSLSPEDADWVTREIARLLISTALTGTTLVPSLNTGMFALERRSGDRPKVWLVGGTPLREEAIESAVGALAEQFLMLLGLRLYDAEEHRAKNMDTGLPTHPIFTPEQLLAGFHAMLIDKVGAVSGMKLFIAFVAQLGYSIERLNTLEEYTGFTPEALTERLTAYLHTLHPRAIVAKSPWGQLYGELNEGKEHLQTLLKKEGLQILLRAYPQIQELIDTARFADLKVLIEDIIAPEQETTILFEAPFIQSLKYLRQIQFLRKEDAVPFVRDVFKAIVGQFVNEHQIGFVAGQSEAIALAVEQLQALYEEVWGWTDDLQTFMVELVAAREWSVEEASHKLKRLLVALTERHRTYNQSIRLRKPGFENKPYAMTGGSSERAVVRWPYVGIEGQQPLSHTGVWPQAQALLDFLSTPTTKLPKYADIIVIFGNDLLASSRKGAELYKQYTAAAKKLGRPFPKIFVTGGSGRDTPAHWVKGEAHAHQQILREHAISPGRIFRESRATNTEDNAIAAANFFLQRGYTEEDPVDTVVVIQSPASTLRAQLTLEKWAGTLARRVVGVAPFDPDIERSDPATRLRLLETAVGEIGRLLDYPGKGYFRAVEIPDEILQLTLDVQRSLLTDPSLRPETRTALIRWGDVMSVELVRRALPAGRSPQHFPPPAPFEPTTRILTASGNSNMSYLNRHTSQWSWMRRELWPTMIQAKVAAGRKQIEVIILGASTGEELARAYHEIILALQDQHEDPRQWILRIQGWEIDAGTAAAAARRLAGEEPFVYDLPERADKAPLHLDYAQQCVKTLNSFLGVPGHSLEVHQADFQTAHLDELYPETDLVIENQVFYQLGLTNESIAFYERLARWARPWMVGGEFYYLHQYGGRPVREVMHETPLSAGERTHLVSSPLVISPSTVSPIPSIKVVAIDWNSTLYSESKQTLRKGAREFLEGLGDRGITAYVWSNNPDVWNHVIRFDLTGLLQKPAWIIKDKRAQLTQLIEHLRVPPDQIVAMGDEAADILVAKRLGTKAILIRSRSSVDTSLLVGKMVPDAVIPNLYHPDNIADLIAGGVNPDPAGRRWTSFFVPLQGKIIMAIPQDGLTGDELERYVRRVAPFRETRQFVWPLMPVMIVPTLAMAGLLSVLPYSDPHSLTAKTLIFLAAASFGATGAVVSAWLFRLAHSKVYHVSGQEQHAYIGAPVPPTADEKPLLFKRGLVYALALVLPLLGAVASVLLGANAGVAAGLAVTSLGAPWAIHSYRNNKPFGQIFAGHPVWKELLMAHPSEDFPSLYQEFLNFLRFLGQENHRTDKPTTLLRDAHHVLNRWNIKRVANIAIPEVVRPDFEMLNAGVRQSLAGVGWASREDILQRLRSLAHAAPRNETVLSLGSSDGEGLPLLELVLSYREVTLVDLDDVSLQRGMERLRRDLVQDKLGLNAEQITAILARVHVIREDISGIVEEFTGHIDHILREETSDARLVDALVTYLRSYGSRSSWPAPAFGAHDLVICPLVMTQLQSALPHVMQKQIDARISHLSREQLLALMGAVNEFTDAVMKAHLAHLEQWVKPTGHLYWSDTTDEVEFDIRGQQQALPMISMEAFKAAASKHFDVRPLDLWTWIQTIPTVSILGQLFFVEALAMRPHRVISAGMRVRDRRGQEREIDEVREDGKVHLTGDAPHIYISMGLLEIVPVISQEAKSEDTEEDVKQGTPRNSYFLLLVLFLFTGGLARSAKAQDVSMPHSFVTEMVWSDFPWISALLAVVIPAAAWVIWKYVPRFWVPAPWVAQMDSAETRWEGWQQIPAIEPETDEVDALYHFYYWSRHPDWQSLAPQDWKQLKGFVESAQKRQAAEGFPVLVLPPDLLATLLAQPEGLAELLRRVHPYTLQSLEHADSPVSRFTMHEGVYYQLFAEKLLGRLPEGGVNLINIDPHSDAIYQAHEYMSNRFLRGTNQEKATQRLHYKGVTDFNWIAAAVGDGLVREAVTIPPKQTIWTVGHIRRHAEGWPMVMETDISDLGKAAEFTEEAPLWVTVDMDMFSLRSEFVPQQTIYHHGERTARAIIELMVADLGLHRKKIDRLSTAVSPTYISLKATPKQIDMYQRVTEEVLSPLLRPKATAAPTPMGSSPVLKVLLEALGLSDAVIANSENVQETGAPYTLKRLQLPVRSSQHGVPQGLDILRHELTLHYLGPLSMDLVYSKEGTLVAISPTPSTSLPKKLFYIDATPYQFTFPQSSEARAEWEKFVAQYKRDQDVVRVYLSYFKRSSGLEPRRLNSLAPLAHAHYDAADKKWEVAGINIHLFDITRWLSAAAKLGRRIVLPVFPTVYHPQSTQLSESDRNYYKALHEEVSYKKDQRILVVGPGSGLEVWALAQKTELPISVIGINPLEVANVKALAALGGFSVNILVGDNVIDENGHPRFPGIEFDVIVWNMPALEHPLTYDLTHKQLHQYHDGDLGGETLSRFGIGLLKVLAPQGYSLIWNRLPRGTENPAQVIRDYLHLKVEDSQTTSFEVEELDRGVYRISRAPSVAQRVGMGMPHHLYNLYHPEAVLTRSGDSSMKPKHSRRPWGVIVLGLASGFAGGMSLLLAQNGTLHEMYPEVLLFTLISGVVTSLVWASLQEMHATKSESYSSRLSIYLALSVLCVGSCMPLSLGIFTGVFIHLFISLSLRSSDDAVKTPEAVLSRLWPAFFASLESQQPEERERAEAALIDGLFVFAMHPRLYLRRIMTLAKQERATTPLSEDHELRWLAKEAQGALRSMGVAVVLSDGQDTHGFWHLSPRLYRVLRTDAASAQMDGKPLRIVYAHHLDRRPRAQDPMYLDKKENVLYVNIDYFVALAKKLTALQDLPEFTNELIASSVHHEFAIPLSEYHFEPLPLEEALFSPDRSTSKGRWWNTFLKGLFFGLFFVVPALLDAQTIRPNVDAMTLASKIHGVSSSGYSGVSSWTVDDLFHSKPKGRMVTPIDHERLRRAA